MRCPKCGYVSFDYNLECPKCNKDISAEQQKMNIFPFKPEPPFLLGTLLGETDETHAEFDVDSASDSGSEELGSGLIESDEIIMKWKHVAPKDVRIDPSVSNIIDQHVDLVGYIFPETADFGFGKFLIKHLYIPINIV